MTATLATPQAESNAIATHDFLGAQNSNKDLWYTNSINLKERFPISRRYPLRQTFSWFVAIALLWAMYHVAYGRQFALPIDFDLNSSSAHFEELVLLGAMATVLAIKLIYQVLWLITFQYRTEGFRLILEKGLILKETGSLPLLPIAELYVKRNILDLFFGLYQVHIAVPVDAGKSFARIDGLSRRHAFALKNFLSEQLSRQVFLPPEATTLPKMDAHSVV